MQGKLTIAPWMRRRMARYRARGTSERVIACVMGPPPLPADAGEAADLNPQVDLSNVILFRALGGIGLQTAARVP